MIFFFLRKNQKLTIKIQKIKKKLKIFPSPNANLAKLKVTKDSYAPSANKVLVVKNQFLFFEKGKKQVSKKTDSFLSGLLNDNSEIDNLACSRILKRNSVYNIDHQTRSNFEKINSFHISMTMNESQFHYLKKPNIKKF